MVEHRTTDRFLTPDGLKNLKEELEHLKTARRAEVAEMIREAREGGDISESAAYEDAKQQQAFVEGQISELERLLKDAVVIENRHNGTVNLGSRVTIEMAGGRRADYVIVGSHEASPREGRISTESPVGKALLHRAIGDNVPVETPSGKVNYRIINVD